MANSQVGKMMCGVVKCFCWVLFGCVCALPLTTGVLFFVIVRWQNHLEKEDDLIEKGGKANNLDEVSFESPLLWQNHLEKEDGLIKNQIICKRSPRLRVLFVYSLGLYY